jgi:single-strand DNA-binding protein
MNKTILMGRLARDPEIRYSAGAERKAVANFVLAVDRKYKKDGEKTADFIPCTAFGKSAEFVEKYLRKGIKIALEGHLNTDSYEKDGKTIYTWNIIVESMEFAESKKSESNAEPQPQPSPDENGFMSIPDGMEDVPF